MPDYQGFGQVPSEYEQIENARRILGELFFGFQRVAIKRNWPPRCVKTFWALLWVSRGDAVFDTGVGVLATFSHQHRTTVQRALVDLQNAGWVKRDHQLASGGYWWSVSRYCIPQLTGA